MIREKIISELIKDKDVLDIGCVGQTNEYKLWDIINGQVKSLTGIDTEGSDDKNIIQGNMETYSFDRKFDVIIAGDVLEHVDNQGLFLDNVKKHLKENGVFILTTPNAKWPTVFVPNNPTHTSWHDRGTLKAILQRHNFVIINFRYYYGNKKRYNMLLKPFIMRQGMLAICKLKNQKVTTA